MSAAPFLRPIERAWVAAGPYGAPNYDEYADCDAVRADAAARPDSVVAVDNPQCFPGGLLAAAGRLAAMQADGRYRETSGLLRYDLGTARAVIGLVSTDEISSGPHEPGRLWRNEEVFADTVVERREHLRALRHLISPVLLVPDVPSLELPAGVGEPLVTETDARGVIHRLWPAPPISLDAAAYYVADGNHRSLAAQQAGFGVCLAVVVDPAGLTIEPYHRLVHGGPDLLAAVHAWDPTPVDVLDPAHTHLYAGGRLYRLTVPVEGGPVERLPHRAVEQLLVGLGHDPVAVTYVGGTGSEPALLQAVDDGAAGAFLMRAVTPAEFAAVGAARLPMPRKSTWFTPKARSGLVLAQL